MMDFFDEINGLEYLFLVDIKNLPANKLLITIKEATISGEEEEEEEEEELFVAGKNLGPVKGIHKDGPGKIYELHFKSYGAYHVTNESFSILNKKDERVGRLFCIFSKSTYMDYIRETTVVNYTYDYDGTLKHFSINCLQHTIDIVTVDEPDVKRIDK